MIEAIFYSRFDVIEGPKVVHQVPTNSITTSALTTSSAPSTSNTKPILHFPSISSFIIPRQTFCSHALTLLSGPHRILTHPICLTSPHYPRNEFIFSFSLVLHHRTPFAPYASVCTKLATLFKHLEETSAFLSRDLSSAPNTGRIFALCEILLEDLNNYSEAMIPVDEANTLNVKLFPTYAPPPPLLPHQVPLATVNLDKLKDDSWDLTMLRILPYVDGINSLRQIAWRADADYKLARKAVEHLVYYGCVMLVDVWSFGAVYAPTEGIGELVRDEEMVEEGRRYVRSGEGLKALNVAAGMRMVGGEKGGGMGVAAGGRTGQGLEPDVAEKVEKVREYLDGSGLVEMYMSLRQGLTLRSWCLEHTDLIMSGVFDVRRFINFGIVKGFLYRVHKYAIAKRTKGVQGGVEGVGAATSGINEGLKKVPREKKADQSLGKYLDGMHCFDEICTELAISEKDLMSRLKDYGDVQIFYK